MDISFNGILQPIGSIEQLSVALDRFDQAALFDLSLSVPEGPCLVMLRNAGHAWLMYLRNPGDTGFMTVGDPSVEGVASYTLANGQVDEYPLSWCVDIELCYKAIGYFFANDGERYEHVTWQEA